MYVNVAFPLRIAPLTYKVPDGAPTDMVGRIVRAPLAGRSIPGLVMTTVGEPESRISKKIREVQGIYQPVFSAYSVAFLQWLADYYLAPVGMALRSSFFEEISGIVMGASPIKDLGDDNKFAAFETMTGQTNMTDSSAAIHGNIRLGGYRSFLYHAASLSGEKAFLIETLSYLSDSLSDAVILVPEIANLEGILPALKKLFGERVCILHSRLRKKEVSGALRGIISGSSDIVIGTRSAILAPLRKVSFIAALSEHSRSYKAEEGLRYNGRDVAVMRGFYEKASVLLSSSCPSVESIYNAEIGKYSLLKPARSEERPKIKIAALKDPGVFLAPDILKEARHLAGQKKRVLFLVSRKGYSLLRCDDCGFIERCGTCDVPLVFHKEEAVLKCHYCGAGHKVPVSCVQCGGNALKAFGAGTERIKEQVEAMLKTEALVVGKGGWGKDSDVASLVIGASYARGLSYKKNEAVSALFSAAAFLNIDSLLLQPDFRLYERALQEVMGVVEMVGNDGTIFLQTRMPQNKILRFIRSYDFSGFYSYELSQRKSFNNPPFARLILFTLPVKDESGALLAEIQRIVHNVNAGNVEILGPAELPYQSKKYHQCIQVLMKSKERSSLHAAARAVLKELGKIKSTKQIIVEVDPLKI